MRICLLHPPRPGGRGTNLVPPVGLLYLGAVLEAEGHRVVLLDAARTGRRGAALRSDVEAASPDVLMVSAFTSDIEVLSGELTGITGALPSGSRIWLGGAHASCAGAAALEDLPQVEAVFTGEGERTVLEALRHLDGGPRPSRGVIYRDDPRDVEPGFVDDLSTLPLPAWHLAPPALYRGLPNGVVLKRTPYAPIITTRGCPCRCTFCAGFRITGRKVRHRPMKQVWDEIELLHREYGVREIHIEDDNFTIDREYAAEFCREAIGRRLPVLFSTPNGVRLDTIDDELARLMKQAGWYVVHCGIESGSDRVLESVRKGTTTGLVREKVALLRRAGLPAAGYFILGLPGETEEDIGMTLRFSRSIGLAWAQFAAFLPIPGSEAGDAWLSAHDTEQRRWRSFHNTVCPAPPEGMTVARLKQLQRRAFLGFYLRPSPLLRGLWLLTRPGAAGRLISRVLAYTTRREAKGAGG
ncbi:B12-binding domain-containing radical SAM protein [Candidatus Fermentibacteria bacterium]|nr:B12-binding domain-containing radical SAM protein [Candidatus Fermentibacteria bacterium]